MSPYGPQVLEGCEMIKWAKRRVYLQLVEGIGGWWALVPTHHTHHTFSFPFLFPRGITITAYRIGRRTSGLIKHLHYQLLYT
jgi:hypothetical protein